MLPRYLSFIVEITVTCHRLAKPLTFPRGTARKVPLAAPRFLATGGQVRTFAVQKNE